MSDSYRVGNRQPHNLYRVTPEHPEGVPVGHACKPDPETAALIVEALNARGEADRLVVEGIKQQRRIDALMHWCAEHLGRSHIHREIRRLLEIPDAAYPWQLPEPSDPAGEPCTFEAMLADPHEQFDPRGELLASIADYTNAPPAAASARPKHHPQASDPDLDAARAEGYAQAIAVLRDDVRYQSWWTKLPQQDPAYGYWQAPARKHLADYLETVKMPLPGTEPAAAEGSGTVG